MVSVAMFAAGLATALFLRRSYVNSHANPSIALDKKEQDSAARGDTPYDVGVAKAFDQPVPGTPTLSDRARTAQLVDEIQRIVGSTDLKELERVFTKLLPALIRADPAAAARLAESIVDADLREEVMRRVAQLWAERDSTGALAWAAALPNEAEREAAIAEVSTQVARLDPARALEMQAQTLTPDHTHANLENLAQHWAETDFSAALKWTLDRAPSTQREGLIARLGFVRAQVSPLEAATLVSTNMEPGYAQNEAIVSVLHQWAQRDLKGAASWLGQFPDDGFRERGLRELSHIAQYHVSTNSP